MNVYGAIYEILGTREDVHLTGRVISVDSRFIDILERYQRKHWGLPHPLRRFALNGSIQECTEAEILLVCVHELSLREEGSIERRSAEWLLLENETMYSAVCKKAGIDGQKLRRNLQRVERAKKKRDKMRSETPMQIPFAEQQETALAEINPQSLIM